MGKKNRKDRSANDTIDTLDLFCSHIRKGIDHSLLKRVSLNEHWNLCQDCEPVSTDDNKRADDEDHRKSPADSKISENHRETPAVWMCLKCGHRGCGRNSDKQHAIKHYETPRSEPHMLVLSLDVWSVWCYICDEEVQYSSTGQLAQLITNIRKQVLSEPGKKTSNRRNNASSEGKKEESVVEKPAEQTLGEKKESKEDHTHISKHNASPKKQKASTVISGAVPVRGLSNLGNTCFFNAVMQNLSQTNLLRDLLNQITDEKSSLTITPDLSSQLEPIQIQLERPGSLTLAMCPFLLHTLLFPSLWYKLILVSSLHRMLFQNCEGFFRCCLANSNLAFLFLRVFKTVVLATPNVFTISLMGLFCVFSLMMACFTDSDSSLDLILTVDSNRFQMQIAHLK